MKAVLLIVPALLTCAGCKTGNSTLGWKFEMGKAGEVFTPALVQQTPGPLAVSPLAAYPALAAGRASLPMQLNTDCGLDLPPASLAPMPRRTAALAAITDNCTLDEVCRRLELLERGMRAGTLPQVYRAMPPTKE